MHRGLVARHRATLEADAITVDYGGWPSITGSDLVLTLPGTNTLELAIKRVPALVVLPYAQAMMARTPMEGTLGVIARTPRLGPALARWAFELQQKRQPFVALPNIRARRRLLPELIGDLTPGQVAEEGARLLRDEGARRRIIQELTAIPDEAGASRRILDAIEPFGAAP
jgi:lipid-A-disaccharide synthase